MIAETGSLTTVLEHFLSVFRLGRTGIQTDALSLLTLIAVIEMTLAALWWAITGSDALVGLLRKLLFIGFFVLVINNYDSLLHVVIEGFISTGKTASSVSGDDLASVRDPSSIAAAGFYVALPVIEHLTTYSNWDILFNLHDVIITGLCGLGILIAYFIIAIQVFVTYLEFAIVSTLGLILIPFGVFKHTAFLAEKVFGAIVSFGVKLMVLGLLVSVTVPVLRGFTLPPDPTWTQLFNLVLVSFAVAALSWHAPGVAAGLLAGGPSLTAATAGDSAVSAAAGGAAGVGLASSTMRAPASIASSGVTATKAAAGGAGAVAGGLRVGIDSAKGRGHGEVGQVLYGLGGAIAAGAHAATRPLRQASGTIREGFQSSRLSVPRYQETVLGETKDKTANQESFSSQQDIEAHREKTSTSTRSAAILRNAKKSIARTARPTGGTNFPLKPDNEDVK